MIKWPWVAACVWIAVFSFPAGARCGDKRNGDLAALLRIEKEMGPPDGLGWAEAAQKETVEYSDDLNKWRTQGVGVYRKDNEADQSVWWIALTDKGLNGWSDAISELANLNSLEIGNNAVDSVRGLYRLKKLERALLNNNRISNIDDIRDLPNLNYLDVSDNPIRRLAPMTGLDGLKWLVLTAKLNDMSPLSGLKNLRGLALIGCDIGDIGTGLDSLPRLRELILAGCRLDAIASLRKLDNIDSLNILPAQCSLYGGCESSSDTAVAHSLLPGTELFELQGMNISSLTVRYGGLTSVAGLAGMDVHYLNVANNEIRDISGLTGMTNLAFCILSNNMITDISPLRSATASWGWDLSNNRIASLEPIGDLLSDKCFELGLDVNGNRLPLSQLQRLVGLRNVHAGVQNNVALPSLGGVLHVDEKYDISSECVFDGKATRFELLNKNGNPVDKAKYVVEEGAIRFFEPGEFVLKMENDAVFSEGMHPGTSIWIFQGQPGIVAARHPSRLVNYDYEEFWSPQNRYGKPHPLAVVYSETLTVER